MVQWVSSIYCTTKLSPLPFRHSFVSGSSGVFLCWNFSKSQYLKGESLQTYGHHTAPQLHALPAAVSAIAVHTTVLYSAGYSTWRLDNLSPGLRWWQLLPYKAVQVPKRHGALHYNVGDRPTQPLIVTVPHIWRNPGELTSPIANILYDSSWKRPFPSFRHHTTDDSPLFRVP